MEFPGSLDELALAVGLLVRTGGAVRYFVDCFAGHVASALALAFTPTSASWINQVERWFAELTRKQIQRGVHTSVRQLEADIRTFIELHNKNPKPFKWTKSADQILASVKRFCHKAQQTLCGEL
ncbi:hypothetical protein ACVIHI_003409 [Bradyrhizobium sp. USDA 4524]|nr:hypothetical protein [Bradyrhizobium sp. USDA 4537]MCP1990106.1 hypothetical protein [Bradyrhizobium sp. USDA 4539]